MFLEKIFCDSEIRTFQTEESVSDQSHRCMAPKFFSQPATVKKEATSSSHISKLLLSADKQEKQLNLKEGNLHFIKSGKVSAFALSDSPKPLGSPAFKPRMWKLVQPCDPGNGHLCYSQADLSWDETQSSYSQACSISQTRDIRQDTLPEFSIHIDSSSDKSRVASVTPKSLSKFGADERVQTKIQLDSVKPQIDTIIDVLYLLNKNPQLVAFHRERNGGTPSNAISENRSHSTTTGYRITGK